MRGLVAALGAVFVCGMTAAIAPAEAKQIDEFTLGQWAGFSYTNDQDGQFTDCEIWAWNRDNVQIGISVLKNWSLELWLNSKAWNLPADQSYPISYWIDRNKQYSGRAQTYSGKFVVIAVERDQDVFDELQNGGRVTFRTQNEDYVFDLSGSRAALNRLLDCVDRHGKEASTNPFGGSGAVESDQQPNTSQQQNDNPASSSDTNMEKFTLTPDEVRAFLVDVTGAKPSMISVDAKTYKNGMPYYAMKTPIGDGEFWQEQLAGRDLGNLVSRYLDAYKKDCSGSFEPVVNDMLRGDHGSLVTGGAACSASKFQDNGPEYLSYSAVEVEGVVSFYMTFVGGNAGKAKTDSLGKLIARRSEETIK
jgi:hypothetical protein